VIDPKTGRIANIVLTTQTPSGDALPVILDIEAIANGTIEPGNWSELLRVLQSLRELKNRIFMRSVTKTCETLFR